MSLIGDVINLIFPITVYEKGREELVDGVDFADYIDTGLQMDSNLLNLDLAL